MKDSEPMCTVVVLLLSWDGRDHELTELEPATHVLTNVGHRYLRESQVTGSRKLLRVVGEVGT
jgi:hypothetical protein